jgi:hypothetical protein
MAGSTGRRAYHSAIAVTIAACASRMVRPARAQRESRVLPANVARKRSFFLSRSFQADKS